MSFKNWVAAPAALVAFAALSGCAGYSPSYYPTYYPAYSYAPVEEHQGWRHDHRHSHDRYSEYSRREDRQASPPKPDPRQEVVRELEDLSRGLEALNNPKSTYVPAPEPAGPPGDGQLRGNLKRLVDETNTILNRVSPSAVMQTPRPE